MDNWKNGVTVVRRSLAGRAATAFISPVGQKTWSYGHQQPGANTGMHHHQQHEVTIYVVRGKSEIRWGERLEFAAEIGQGDFVYFAPYVPHQERNPSDRETVDFVVVRSGNEGFVTKLDAAPVERPETVY
jgi:uncharacterized RmlC-like cupin family protein